MSKQISRTFAMIFIGLLLFSNFAVAAGEEVVEEVEDNTKTFNFFEFFGFDKPEESVKSKSRAVSSKAAPVGDSEGFVLKQNAFGGNILSDNYRTDLFTGSASYAYSIAVPPGVNGLEPGIALSYNHYAANSFPGILGNGWSLGMPHIIRDVNHSIEDSSDDSFTINLNGINSKLVIGSDGRYHTKQESYLAIDKYDLFVEPRTEYWIVRTRDGTKYTFGLDESNILYSDSESYAVKWNLDSIEDTFGNKIAFSYRLAPNGDKGYVYLDKISYNEDLNRIDFDYEFLEENRRESYSQGYEISKSGILRNIFVKHDGKIIRKYDFDYQKSDSKILLKSVQEFGSDGVSSLPKTEFTYESVNAGWTEESSWDSPVLFSKASGTQKTGSGLIDVNGDGLMDIVETSSEDIGSLKYYENTGEGWTYKEQFSDIIPGGIVDDKLVDQGVRFVDVNGDTRIDILQLRDGYRKVMINTGNGFVEGSLAVPDEVTFVDNVALTDYECNPAACTAGYIQDSLSCSGDSCTRSCTQQTCSSAGTLVRSGVTEDPSWPNDKDYDEEDQGDGFVPSANKCYKFEFIGSPNSENSPSECYDLETYEIYSNGNYDNDCDGKDLDAYGGLGFVGAKKADSWLGTVPPGDDYGFIYDPNRNLNKYWSNRYISHYGKDSQPDSGDGDDWGDLSNDICADAGSHEIRCAPTAEACYGWNQAKCGYGCAGEELKPFVTVGVYRSNNNDFSDALLDYAPLCSEDIIEDNDYNGGGTFNVWQYNAVTNTETKTCSVPLRDVGYRVADLNGDGEIDFVRGLHNDRKVWINTGSDFVEDSAWIIPQEASFYSEEGSATGTQLADVNGDGLPDLVKGYKDQRKTWINTGNGWKEDSAWTIPAGAEFFYNEWNGVQISDVNGDGLNDIVRVKLGISKTWINNGRGFVEDSAWAVGVADMDLTRSGTHLSDVNSDGKIDILFADDKKGKKTLINKASKAYLLKKIDNGFGGEISVEYKKISDIDNTGDDNIVDLGLPGYLVESVQFDNGLDNEHQIISKYSYEYDGGMFDSEDREFRGFSVVKEILPEGGEISHWYYQDDNLRGLEAKQEIYDEEGNIYSKEEKGYIVVDIGEEYNFVNLFFTENSLYDGEAEALVIRSEYLYDTYGNLLALANLGDRYITGDERYVIFEYVANTVDWIVDKPARKYSENSENVKISETLYYYDGGDWGDAPIQGALSEEEFWLDGENNPHVTYEYDGYGNVVEVENSRGNSVYYTYDETNTFLIGEKNVLEHVSSYEYEKGTGNLLKETDPNGLSVEYSYDVFGRQINTVMPYDSSTYPTEQIVYNIESSPQEIIVLTRENAGTTDTFDSYSYFDGLGNLIQEKSEYKDGKFSTIDYYYDSLERISSESEPYSSNLGYNIDFGAGKINYKYDVLDRVISFKDLAGHTNIIEYNQKIKTHYNEYDIPTDYFYDIYGNIENIVEYNGGEVYLTSYSYDDLNNLFLITDNQGNFITYSYDTLGRKLSMVDPDLGTWSYEYDSVGNLIKQIDNKGNEIVMVYDEIDRLTDKITPDEELQYGYDYFWPSVLKDIEADDYDISYQYDDRLRIIEEELNIEDETFVTKYTYDSMNRVLTKELPDSSLIEYEYGSDGLLSSIKDVVDIEYNEAGLPLKRTYANGLVTNMDYSANFRIEGIVTGGIQNKDYNYDRSGNLDSMEDLVHDASTDFEYDDLDRMTFAKRIIDGTEEVIFDLSYSYDSIGNLLQVNGSDYLIDFSYDESDVVHSPAYLDVNGLEIEEEVLIDNSILAPILNIIEAITGGNTNTGSGSGGGGSLNEASPEDIIDLTLDDNPDKTKVDEQEEEPIRITNENQQSREFTEPFAVVIGLMTAMGGVGIFFFRWFF